MPRLLLTITLLLLGSVPAHAVETAAPVTWLDVVSNWWADLAELFGGPQTAAETGGPEVTSKKQRHTGWIDPTGQSAEESTQSAVTQDEETPSLTGWIDPTG